MSTPDITQLLSEVQQGDGHALNRLYPLVYDELRHLAHLQLRRHSQSTLRTTALVHEAYLKLFDQEHADVKNRVHFYALSARAMRHILVDHFRRGRAQKRGGDRKPITFEDGEVPIEQRGEVILALDEALERLATFDERLSRVVEYKFFGGMTEDEIATVVGLSPRTIRSDWRKARLWLAHELNSV